MMQIARTNTSFIYSFVSLFLNVSRMIAGSIESDKKDMIGIVLFCINIRYK
jgi:hypothetical protein